MRGLSTPKPLACLQTPDRQLIQFHVFYWRINWLETHTRNHSSQDYSRRYGPFILRFTPNEQQLYTAHNRMCDISFDAHHTKYCRWLSASPHTRLISRPNGNCVNNSNNIANHCYLCSNNFRIIIHSFYCCCRCSFHRGELPLVVCRRCCFLRSWLFLFWFSFFCLCFTLMPIDSRRISTSSFYLLLAL